MPSDTLGHIDALLYELCQPVPHEIDVFRLTFNQHGIETCTACGFTCGTLNRRTGPTPFHRVV